MDFWLFAFVIDYVASFITLCLAMSIAFYGVLMKKTALARLLAALFLAYLGGCMGINLLILKFFRSLQEFIAAVIHRIHVC